MNSTPAQSTLPPLADSDPGALWARWIKIAVLGALFGFLFRDELMRTVATWKTPDESHGILIPAFSLFFIWQDREALRRIKPSFGLTNLLGLLLIGASLWLYGLCLTRRFGSPRPYLMIPVLAGLTLLAGGWPVFKRFWLPILFLFFAFQLPPTLHDRITTPLRIWSSVLATVILNFLPGTLCESSGVTISGAHNGVPFDLNVADACSGMRLLRTFVALGVAMAWLEKRAVSHRAVLLISTIPIAIFCNMLRVILTGMIFIYIGPQYAQGMMHALLGLLMLGLAFWLYGRLAWIMNNLFTEGPSATAPADGDVLLVRPGRPPAR